MGPLAGIRVVEIAGIGPVPHAAMVLADLGADVVQVGRAPAAGPDGIVGADDLLARNRRIAVADLKDPNDLEHVRAIVGAADVLLEGFRPGVMERLGLGPAEFESANPGLIYGRMTGWGQSGPWSQQPGHDINYLAATGLLEQMGPAGSPPLPPLNLVADYGGGSMLLVVGVLAALQSRHSSGKGQVIDAAMAEGASMLGQLVWSWKNAGRWSDERGENLLDGSAPFYSSYECADGGFVAVSALEDVFYQDLITQLDLQADDLPDRWDHRAWDSLRAVIADRFKTHDRSHWEAAFDGPRSCVTPVLTFNEARANPHFQSRESFVEVDGVPQPAPAPRFSGTPLARPVSPVSRDLGEVLTAWS